LGGLKTNGFNLEKQNFTAPHKIELLMSLLVLVYAMAICEGVIIYQTEEKPKMKIYKVKEKNGGFRCVTYPAKSVLGRVYPKSKTSSSISMISSLISNSLFLT
jgi:hypothetical protein